MRTGLLFLLLALAEWPGYAQTAHTPPPGSPLRKLLLDALRQSVEAELKQAVVFEVSFLKATDTWAFGQLQPRQSQGRAIDYRRTTYADDVVGGLFDEGLYALWQRQPGGWRVRTYVIGATDLPYGCWWREFKAPKTVFLYTEKTCLAP